MQKLKYILLIIIALLAQNIYSQTGDVIIRLKQPPPNLMGVGNMWDLTLDNTTGGDMKIYLVGTATEDKDGLIIEGKSKVFTIKNGRTSYKYNDFSGAEIKYNNGKYKEIILRTGNAPEGNYTICVTAFNESGEVVGSENCIIQPVQQTGSISLISPEDKAEIDPDTLPGLIFSWTSLQGAKDYTLRIIEIKGELSGDEDDAIMKDKHPFFEQKGITTTSFLYPITAPKIDEEKKYAWAVFARGVWSDVRWWWIKPHRFSCSDLKVNFVKNDSDKEDMCCYSLKINNGYTGIVANKPVIFRIITTGNNILSAVGLPAGWGQNPVSVPPNTNYLEWKNSSGFIPAGLTNLGNLCFGSSLYVTYEWQNKERKIICRDSVLLGGCGDSCKNNLIRNGGLVYGNVPGQMPSPGAVQYWTRGYGSPSVDNNPSDGFIEQGFIKLSGSLNNGQSVVHALDPNNKIIAGKKYKFSVAVRFLSSQNTIDYVKIRCLAINGNIYNASGVHPQPSTDIAIIGRSGKIRDCNDWSVIEFPVWTANKDFLNIAVNAFTNDNSNATIFIDNVILCESEGSNCDEVQLNSDGTPIMPAGYGNLPQGFTCQPEEEEDDYYNGALQDLYPGYNGTSDIYSQNTNACFSIGGTIPQEVTDYNCDDSLKALGIDMTCAQLQELLNQDYVPGETKKISLPPIPPIDNKQCDTPNVERYNNMPFHGRDIIYVHGLQMNHIIDRASGMQGADGYWPANANEYYTGYYHNVAVHNMLPHIDHFLRNRGNKNRFLIVSYDCSQSAELAVYSVLTQIREAMENGRGVEFDPSDPRKNNCFGRDYVFISHSTGAIIADVALSIANKTKTPGIHQNQYGNIGLISDRCRGRVSIQGAYNGSNLAKIAVMGAQVFPGLFTIAVTAISQVPLTFQNLNTLSNTPQIITNSILTDLVPEITRYRWGNYINDINVPVFTLAGGHPSVILGPLKYSIHPGFDDGVLDMDCANANNNPLSFGPSRFSAVGIKVIDMGIPLIRRIEYYLDQKISSSEFTAASTVYLSPTGMVQPVSSIIIDPQNHFANHYSFVQSSKEHWFNATELGSGNIPCDYKRTSPGGYTNNEEELVVTNASLFTPGLIHPSIISQMGETLKDLHIYYPWIKVVFRHGFPRISIYWKKFYIWKRTYHKLNDNCMYDVDYAYSYLFKQ